MSLREPPSWSGTSSDPNDEQFGHVVEPTTLDEAEAYDAVIVGEPYDGAVISRRGAREGPAAIREELAGVKSHHFDAGPVRSVGDLGNVDVAADAQTADAQATVRAVAREVHATDAFPVFLGGDNSLSVPNAGPLLDRGSLGVVNVDAHLDVREVRDGPTSGTPYRQLHEAGLDAYVCVGARHFETATRYHDFVRERNGAVVTAEEVGADPVDAVDRALDAMAGVDRVYLSLDVDVLDAAAAPGVSAPTPGGLSTRECFRALRLAAADDRVAGFEVVECAPPLDEGGRTVSAAARAVAHVLSARAAGGDA
jgi:formiminoglutamase/agmatinase